MHSGYPQRKIAFWERKILIKCNAIWEKTERELTESKIISSKQVFLNSLAFI